MLAPFYNIMANCRDSKIEIVELLKEAKEIYQNSIEIIVENKKCLTKGSFHSPNHKFEEEITDKQKHLAVLS